MTSIEIRDFNKFVQMDMYATIREIWVKLNDIIDHINREEMNKEKE